jgi:hypothetical protein
MERRYSKRRWTKRRVNVHQRSKKRELRRTKKKKKTDRSKMKGRGGGACVGTRICGLGCSLWDMATGERLTLVTM